MVFQRNSWNIFDFCFLFFILFFSLFSLHFYTPFYRDQGSFEKDTLASGNILSSSTDPSTTFWVDNEGNGDGTTETHPAGNLTYVLVTQASPNDIINVKPGIYNSSIEQFYLPLKYENLTVQAVGSRKSTILNGTRDSVAMYVTASHCLVKGFTFKNAFCGIIVDNVVGTNLKRNLVKNLHRNGVYLHNTLYSTLKNNTIAYVGDHGVLIDEGSRKNKILLTSIHHTFIGIQMTQASKNIIISNNITSNRYGFSLCRSKQNLFYHNNFISNEVHGNGTTYVNFFNSSHIGNFWEGYTGVDTNDDEIGDSPYEISGGVNRDVLPSIDILNITKEAYPPSVVILNPQTSKTYVGSALSINWIGGDESAGIYQYEVKVADNWTIVDNNMTFQLSGLSPRTYNISVKATDNSGKTTIVSLIIEIEAERETNIWKIWILPGSIVLLIGIGVTITLIFLKKRKEKREKL